MVTHENEVLDWTAEIDDGEQFFLIPEGDYLYEVIEFNKGQFPGSAALVAGPKAVMKLKVYLEDGRSTSFDVDFIMNGKLMWKISEFFCSVGLKKKGENLNMDWGRSVGCWGYAHLKPREGSIDKKTGEPKLYNNVDSFYLFDREKISELYNRVVMQQQPQQQPVQSQPQQQPFQPQQQGMGWMTQQGMGWARNEEPDGLPF